MRHAVNFRLRRSICSLRARLMSVWSPRPSRARALNQAMRSASKRRAIFRLMERDIQWHRLHRLWKPLETFPDQECRRAISSFPKGAFLFGLTDFGGQGVQLALLRIRLTPLTPYLPVRLAELLPEGSSRLTERVSTPVSGIPASSTAGPIFQSRTTLSASLLPLPRTHCFPWQRRPGLRSRRRRNPCIEKKACPLRPR